MKLVTYSPSIKGQDFDRLGALIDQDNIMDLNWSYITYLVEVGKKSSAYDLAARRVPSNIMDFLQGGRDFLSAAQEAIDFVTERIQSGKTTKGPAGETVIYKLTDVNLKAPVPRPGKILAAGRNFSKHLAESAEGWKERGREVSAPPFPLGFVKVSTTIVGTDSPVPLPKDSERVDYEVEIAAVIGRKGKYIPIEDAFDFIVGYTIINDISARDWQYEEMKNNFLTLGKNFDGFCPMGPWLVTSDEIKDPNDLKMELRINDEIRQDSNTQFMIFKFPDLVNHWSKMTLEPGDLITSGTPEGVASHRKPDPMPWFLKAGDVVEATIDGLGTLKNTIVTE